MGTLPRTLARAVRMRTIAHMPRLSEATGDHGRTEGDPRVVRLAILGDSAAAGVGAETHEDALAGRLARAVTGLTGRTVDWRVTAESGATARRIGQVLVRDLTVPVEGWHPDVVLVICGVNDLLRWRSLSDWRRHLEELFAAIRSKAPRAAVAVSAVAPADRFPMLPGWLRPLAAHRVRTMNRVLARVAASAGVVFISLDGAGGTGDASAAFSDDGLHLGPEGYGLWATLLAPDIVMLIESVQDGEEPD